MINLNKAVKTTADGKTQRPLTAFEKSQLERKFEKMLLEQSIVLGDDDNE